MLRPQVFALQEGRVKIGVIASERQAINAMLGKLANDGKIPAKFADVYWNARGGSHTDGGAFVFTVFDGGMGKKLTCTDKFGREISTSPGQAHFERDLAPLSLNASISLQLGSSRLSSSPTALYEYLLPVLKEAEFSYFSELLEELKRFGTKDESSWRFSVDSLTLLFDRLYDTGSKKRGSLLHMCSDALNEMFGQVPLLVKGRHYSRSDWAYRTSLHVCREGRRGLRAGKCRGTPVNQRGRKAQGCHQRHLSGLSSRVFHGRGPLQRRRICDH